MVGKVTVVGSATAGPPSLPRTRAGLAGGLVSLPGMMDCCLALDVGGTKLAAGLVGQGGEVLARHRIPTPTGLGPDQLLDAVVGLARQAARAAWRPPLACGVGCGGPMEPGGERVSPLNIPAWSGFPLRSALADALQLPTYVDNDAKALALGEGWVGAAVGCRDYLAMVVSTGVGAGIVSSGRLLDGRLGNAGHIGHLTVEPEGRTCPCGARGCLEAEASGTAIRALTGRPPEQAPVEVVERTGRLVGRAVAGVANLLDLDLALVAGSVALGFGARFFAAAQREVEARARLAFSAGTRVRPGGLGADGPLVGAGALAWRGLGQLPPGAEGAT